MNSGLHTSLYKGEKTLIIKEIAEQLELKVISGLELLDRKVEGGCVGDLLSVVMSKATENCVWVTVQSHVNVVAVASLADVSCVIVSEGFQIDEDAIAKAVKEEVVLLSSKKSSYQLCCELGKLGI
jgi:serine kinase of HPr protein (carbohydrate metabolism regulator)